jgi:hypothetical protein
MGSSMSGTAEAGRTSVHGYAGMRRELEIGVLLAPTRAAVAPAAKALAALLDDGSNVPVRLAGLAVDDSRVRITIAVSLGVIDEIKTAGPASREAVLLVQRIIDDLAGYDPAFVTLPDPSSAEARLAAVAARRGTEATVRSAVRSLASIG